MLTNQSVFDWLDLRSYDIREHQEQMDHLRPGAITTVHSYDHSHLVRALGMGVAAIPPRACASAALVRGREVSCQSLRSAYCHERSQEAGRFSSGTAHAGLTRRDAAPHTDGTLVPQGMGSSCSWRQLASEKAWLSSNDGAVGAAATSRGRDRPVLGASSQSLGGAFSAPALAGQAPPLTSLSPRHNEQVSLPFVTWFEHFPHVVHQTPQLPMLRDAFLR